MIKEDDKLVGFDVLKFKKVIIVSKKISVQ